MGKRSKKRKKHAQKQSTQKPSNRLKTPPNISARPDNQQPINKKGFLSLLWVRLVGITVIITVVGSVLLPQQFKEQFFTSKREKWEAQKFSKGVLVPSSVINLDSPLAIQYGSNTEYLYKDDLERGTPLMPSGFAISKDGAGPFNLRVKMEDGRLFIYAIFKDIETKQIIGIINYQQWQLVNANTFNHADSDTSIRVIDNEGNTVFYLSYINANILVVLGYYVTNNDIIVISNKMTKFPLSKIDQALVEIQKIDEMIK